MLTFLEVDDIKRDLTGVRVWVVLILVALGSDCGFCEHCDKPKCFVKVTAKYLFCKRNRFYTVNYLN